MKKLKNKIFFTLFILLTIFITSVTTVTMYRSYSREKNSIEKIFNRIDDKKKPGPNNNILEEPQNIFVDIDVYTVILDDNGNYETLIDHTGSDEQNEDIEKAAKVIIASHTKSTKIGNLFFTKYSYNFDDNTLTIVDNTAKNKQLCLELLISVLAFIILEIVIYLISSILTKWICEPVINSFEKQKQFVADASHELKTPIAVIMASADAYSNDKKDKWIDNIKNEAERMSKLVKDLLDLAKSEKVNDLEMKKEDLSNLIESSALTYESLLFDKNIKLKYDIAENIEFNCNQDKIKELMSILIDNAIKHSCTKGKITINLKKNNKNIILEVINKGDEIKDEEREKIFERFYKSDNSRNRNDNTYGLGLAIAKNIVTEHKGTIEAFSKDGYTTFKIVF